MEDPVLDLRGEDVEALAALGNLYESLGQWAKLVDVLERQFDIADRDETRVAILMRRARTLNDKLGRGEAASTTTSACSTSTTRTWKRCGRCLKFVAGGRTERTRRCAPSDRRSGVFVA